LIKKVIITAAGLGTRLSSRYEGFGLPILEAQKCSVPVLTMDDAKIPREVKKESITCKGIDDMANKTLELLMDDYKRREISERGRSYASQFTWEDTAWKTLRIYNELQAYPGS
jgi:glycosyltransferase involved in cell wall biosynthesis